ncbi:MAG: hypothetical protein HUJ55_08645, partial [Ileibacterium sp.]|nr:hypothetical protein [Ileibacterium sp.]
YYFDGRWLAAAAWILFCSLAFSAVPVNSRLLGLVFGAAALIMALCRKMGSADVVFLGVMGWVLGLERMEAAMLISCILGLLWFALQRPKEKIVPFCCCLSLGLEAGLLFGYRLASLF